MRVLSGIEALLFLVILGVILYTFKAHLKRRESRQPLITAFYLIAFFESLLIAVESSILLLKPDLNVDLIYKVDRMDMFILMEVLAKGISCLNYTLMVVITLTMYHLKLTLKLITAKKFSFSML